MDELRDFLKDFRDNWRDSYWWLDHQALRTAALSLIAGMVGLAFYWMQLLLERRYRFPKPQEG